LKKEHAVHENEISKQVVGAAIEMQNNLDAETLKRRGNPKESIPVFCTLAPLR
jgi:hypothetical protein